MPYGVSYRGDYGTYRGDPGLFGFLKKVGGGVLSRVIGGTPLGMVGSGILGGLVGRKIKRQMPTSRGFGPQKLPGIGGLIQRVIPGGKTGYAEVGKRRRMNVANPKALRRAIRRQSGFVKLAKKALKGSGYTVAPRGAGRRRGPVTIMESGSGGVQVRR